MQWGQERVRGLGGAAVPPCCRTGGRGAQFCRFRSLAERAAGQHQWEMGPCTFPLAKMSPPSPVPPRRLLNGDIHWEGPDLAPGRRVTRGAWMRPPARAPHPGAELLVGAARALPASMSPRQPRSSAVHPGAPEAQGRQGGHSSSLGRCKRICPLCPDNIVFVAEREEPASTR